MRLTSRPTLNVPLAPLLHPPLPPPELRPLPWLLDQSCPLGGGLSHTSTRCASPTSSTAVTPAAVVVVATPTIFAATPTSAIPAVATVAASLFSLVSFANSSFEFRPKDRDSRRGLLAGP